MSDFLTPGFPSWLAVMTATAWTRPVTALMTALLVAVMGGCSAAADRGSTGSASLPSASSAVGGVPVVLRFGDHTIAATLTDSPASRQLAAMLPLTVHLQDVWRQAKSGRLPGPLTVDDEVRVRHPTPGGIYFWPDTEVIAIYYDDLGLPVPGPGLVRLGVIGTGVQEIAGAGRRLTVRIDSIAATGA